MRGFVTVLALVASVVLLPAAARAQEAQNSITGVARDASGAVLPGVTVEAASPALIEKVRTAVTDGTGQYRIVNLRSGTYTVTFTLNGFNTFKREGIELAGGFVATINADMKVGDARGNDHRDGRDPDRRRAERQTGADAGQRAGAGAADRKGLRQHHAPDSVDDDRGGGSTTGPALARDDCVRRPRRPHERGPRPGGRAQHRGVAQRRRRVGLPAGHRELVGNRHDHVRRPRRSGGRRAGHEHHPEDRRQHVPAAFLRDRPQQHDAERQLHAAGHRRRADASQPDQLQLRHERVEWRPDHQGSVVVLRAGVLPRHRQRHQHVPQQERRRHHQVDLRGRPESGRPRATATARCSRTCG